MGYSPPLPGAGAGAAAEPGASGGLKFGNKTIKC